MDLFRYICISEIILLINFRKQYSTKFCEASIKLKNKGLKMLHKLIINYISTIDFVLTVNDVFKIGNKK